MWGQGQGRISRPVLHFLPLPGSLSQLASRAHSEIGVQGLLGSKESLPGFVFNLFCFLFCFEGHTL